MCPHLTSDLPDKSYHQSAVTAVAAPNARDRRATEPPDGVLMGLDLVRWVW